MFNLLLIAGALFSISALLLNAKRLLQSLVLVCSGSKWMCVAWVLMFLGLATFSKRIDAIQSARNLDSSAINQLIMFGSATVILIVLLLSRHGILSNIFRMPIYMLAHYGMLGIVSAVYSPAPGISAYKGMLILIDVLLVIVALAYLPCKENAGKYLLNLTYFFLMLMVLGAALGGILAHEETYHSIGGVFGFQLYGKWPYLNPNELAFICAIISVVALRRVYENASFIKKYFWIAQLFISIVVLILAQARTSFFSLILAILMLSLLIRKLRWIGIFFVVFISITIHYNLVIGESMSWLKFSEEYFKRGLSENQLATLTGRTELWNTGWKMFSKAPILGHGYDAGVRTDSILMGAHMHNGHMQVLVNSGIVGYILWLLMLVSVTSMAIRLLLKMRWSLNTEAGRFHAESVAVLFIILVRTITAQVLVTHQYSLMVFLAITVHVIILNKYSTKTINESNFFERMPALNSDKSIKI